MRALSARSSTRRRQPLSLMRGSWISLFAMLMIFIGPLISQSMPMDQRASPSMNISMSMPMGMSMDGHGEQAKEHCPPQAEHHALWEKCGYCSLLFNCPALTGGLSFTAFDTPHATTFSTPATRLGHARQTFFPGARSRAPPVAS